MPHSYPHHFTLIKQRMPDWMRNTSTQQRKALRTRLQQSHRATRALSRAMARLQPIEAFCRPLLKDALAHWYPGEPIPPLAKAVLLDRTPDHPRTLSWLEAAMQNLDADTQVRLYASQNDVEPCTLDPVRFVKGVRNLDLGQRYLNHLREQVDTDDFRTLLQAQDRAAFAAALTASRLQGHIDSRGEALGEAALAGAHEQATPNGPARLECGYLSLFGFPLSGALLVRLEPREQTEPCLLYLPGDTDGDIRQYTSLRAVGIALTRRLWDEGFRQFFTRFVLSLIHI